MKINHLSTTLDVVNDVENHCDFKYIIFPAKFANHLSTTLGVVNDVENYCDVKYIIVPAKFANVIMPRRHAQNGVIDDLHSTTVYCRVFSKFSVKW